MSHNAALTPARCILVFFICICSGCSANVALPHGLMPRMHNHNHSLQAKLYLEILKKKLQREMDKYRGNTTSTHQIPDPEVEHEVITKPEIEPEPEPPSIVAHFVVSDSPGKNLLRFKVKRNPVDVSQSEITRLNLWVHIWQKEKKRKREPRRRKHGRLIRIVVHNNSSKGDEVVAELRTRIQKTKWFRISLPISLINDVDRKNNDTLVLRVDCRRCNRRTKLLLPHKGKQKCKKMRKNRKKKRRKNKSKPKGGKSDKLTKRRKCRSDYKASNQRLPFIVIEQRYRNLDRKKRSLTCTPSDIIHRNGTITSRKCCKISTFVEFSEMDLDDFIVTPSGYEVSRCIGRCPRKRRGRRRGRNRNRNRKWRRGKCRAAQTAPLTVWIFNDNHDLTQAHLSDVVVRSCDCG